MRILVFCHDHISLVKMDRGEMIFLNKFSLQICTMYCENCFTDFFIETSKKMSLIES